MVCGSQPGPRGPENDGISMPNHNYNPSPSVPFTITSCQASANYNYMAVPSLPFTITGHSQLLSFTMTDCRKCRGNLVVENAAAFFTSKTATWWSLRYKMNSQSSLSQSNYPVSSLDCLTGLLLITTEICLVQSWSVHFEMWLPSGWDARLSIRTCASEK